MTTTADFVAWLRAEMDRELVAWGRNKDEHVARYDSKRIVAELTAKNAVVDLWETASRDPEPNPGRLNVLGEVVQLLAQPYRDRPGWRPEWTPERRP